MKENMLVSLYVVKSANGKYFAGFDNQSNVSKFVDDPRAAKKFTNKFHIKLRAEEMIVELTIDLTDVNVTVSEPFRPQNKQPKVTD